MSFAAWGASFSQSSGTSWNWFDKQVRMLTWKKMYQEYLIKYSLKILHEKDLAVFLHVDVHDGVENDGTLNLDSFLEKTRSQKLSDELQSIKTLLIIPII